MQAGSHTTAPNRTRRPSAAAGEAVLLALAAPRTPFVQVIRQAGRATQLELAGRLRVTRAPAGQLVISARDASGRWRRSTRLEDTALLRPAQLASQAIVQAAQTTLAQGATAGGLTAADRGYAEKRIRTDLYPEACGERTARTIRAVMLRDIAEPRLLRAACLVFGAGVSIRDYNNMVRAGAPVLMRIATELPNLAPVLAGHVRRLARSAEPAASLGLMGQARAELMCAGDAGRLARRDWKWLSHQSNGTVRRLLALAQEGGTPGQAGWAVRLFAAARIRRPPAVMVALTDAGGTLARALALVREDEDMGRLEDLARLLRLAMLEWRHRAALGQSLRFMRDDLAYLIDWWIDQARLGGALIPHNASWASIVRRQQRWHQMIILRNPEFLLHWHSAVPAHEAAGYRVVPLTDSLMLAREGMEMRHCVASYARDCAAGHTRIFAFESGACGERATVELRRRAARWYAGQVKGPCNAEVSPGMRMAAERLASRYAHADGRR